MKQKKLNNILYVFDVNPYIITQDTDAEVIKVQEESYDGFVEMNHYLAEKIVKYNYHLMCVKVPEWAPYAKEEDPQVQLTFGVYGENAALYIAKIERTNSDNEVIESWEAGVDLTFPFHCNVNETDQCAIEFGDDVDPSELYIIGGEYINIRWQDQETGHWWASTGGMHASISVGFNSYEPSLTFSVDGSAAQANIVKIERTNSDNEILESWEAGVDLTFPFQCNVNETDQCAIEFGDDVDPYSLDITGGEYIYIRWQDQETGRYWASTGQMMQSISVSINATPQPSTYTVTLEGGDIHSHVTVKMNGETVQTNIEYQDVADGTVVDVYPTDNVADYTLESGAVWDTDHWTATVNGADLQITINYDSRADAELSWELNGQPVNYAYVTLGDPSNVFPTIVDPHSVGNIEYQSTDQSVATIDATTGVITLVGEGHANIWAEFRGDSSYKPQLLTYMLYVQAAQPSTYTVTLSGTDILQNATVKMDDVTVSTQSQYQNVADGTVVDVYPTGNVADYTLVSGATWSTDHWTATVNGADLTITINYAHDYSTYYLTTKALGSGDISFSGSGASYRKNNGEWTNYTEAIPVVQDDVVEWKGTITTASDGIGKIDSTGNIDAYGNVMSMLFGDNFANQTDLIKWVFASLFKGNTHLINAENLILPATTLANNCYYEMFSGCTNLNSAPELPATTLAAGCYNSMFRGCTNLNSAPELPATTLAYSCYQSMFQGCRNLNSAPELPATTLATICYYEMFSGCTSLNNVTCLATDISASNCVAEWLTNTAASGTLYKDPNMTGWVVGTNVPSGWTIEDYSE